MLTYYEMMSSFGENIIMSDFNHLPDDINCLP